MSERSNPDSNAANSTVGNDNVQVSKRSNSDSNTFFNETFANSTVVNGTQSLNSTILNGTDILNGTHYLNNTTTNGNTTLNSTQILSNTIISNIQNAGIDVQPLDEMLCIKSNNTQVYMEANAYSVSYVEECGNQFILYEVLKPRSIILFNSNLRSKKMGRKEHRRMRTLLCKENKNYFN